MKIILVHNRYLQPGGEDRAVEAEAGILRSMGHSVDLYVRSNDEIARMGWRRASVICETLWSRRSYQSLHQLLRGYRPDVVHCHNTFPLISPSVYFACQREGVPVVQTLHNYRLLCPAATFSRDGRVCEECVEHSLMRGIRYGCYHRSPLQTAVVALMLKVHRALGTWTRKVDAYIALTEFSRRKFIESGLPANRIYTKGNFSSAPQPSGFDSEGRKGALFVGRLEREKGILTLLSAWRVIRGVSLSIVGQGPLHNEVRRLIERYGLDNVHLVGQVDGREVQRYYREAGVLIVPSEWYEGFPLVVAEAFASGLPVVASRTGGLPELVHDGETGLLFNPGDSEDLAAKIGWIVDHPHEAEIMGQRARELSETRYSVATNYQQLLGIYSSVVGQ